MSIARGYIAIAVNPMRSPFPSPEARTKISAFLALTLRDLGVNEPFKNLMNHQVDPSETVAGFFRKHLEFYDALLLADIKRSSASREGETEEAAKWDKLTEALVSDAASVLNTSEYPNLRDSFRLPKLVDALEEIVQSPEDVGITEMPKKIAINRRISVGVRAFHDVLEAAALLADKKTGIAKKARKRIEAEHDHAHPDSPPFEDRVQQDPMLQDDLHANMAQSIGYRKAEHRLVEAINTRLDEVVRSLNLQIPGLSGLGQ